jgi:hypothetical protein
MRENNKELGKIPLSLRFAKSGTRQLTLIKPCWFIIVHYGKTESCCRHVRRRGFFSGGGPAQTAGL